MYWNNQSLLRLKIKTATRIKTIPQRAGNDKGSPRSSTLKSVADIGSTIPKEAAIPTGKSFKAIVYKKYGNTHVQIPRPILKGKIADGFCAIMDTISGGLEKADCTRDGF